MKVKMLRTQAGPNGTCDAGSIVEFSDEDAKELCRVGYAEPAERPKKGERVPEPEVETAEFRETEEVTTKRGRGRPKKIEEPVLEDPVLNDPEIDTEE